MSHDSPERPPASLRAIYRRLFPGAFGAEVCRDLEQDWSVDREQHGAVLALVRYLAHVLRPASWALARELRRRATRDPGSGLAPTSAGISWLDVKLGLRILLKYPMMSFVNGLAIAMTIACAFGAFIFFQDFLLRPGVPLPDGDRIVSLGLRTTDTNRTERRLLHDVAAWREELESVEDVSIWRDEDRTIVSADGRGELATFAMMSASGFEVAGVPPLLGRPLLPADEVPGAEPVLVIGYDEWTGRFASDPEIVGRRVRIGRAVHTIVGVMPEGFGFPYAATMWLPFTDRPEAYAPMETRGRYFAFGRLAPRVTLAQAQAEMTAVTARRASLLPETHAHVRGQVMAYTDTHTGMDDAGEGDFVFVRVVLGVLSLIFVLIPFANVAILVYARTATRSGEIAVRTALGASRRRVVVQLFTEALVLSVVAALAGVGIAFFALGRVDGFMENFLGGGGLPFWAKTGRDPWAVAYAVGLAVFAAVVAGVLPGLQATGKRVQHTLKSAAGNGMRLGKVWSALVVTQVAITVACVPLVGWAGLDAVAHGMTRPTFAAGEYVGAVFGSDPLADGSSPGPAAGDAIDEIERRLEADPRVAGVTRSSRPPTEIFSVGFSDFERIDVEGLPPSLDGRGHPVGATAVDPGFFALLGTDVIQGRELTAGDVAADPQPVLVNAAFSRRILGGANPVGRLVREHRGADAEPAPWREIVGVVDELVESPLRPEAAEGRMFSPLDRARATSAVLTVHAPAATADVAQEIRRIATAVDPGLSVYSVGPLSSPSDPVRSMMTGVAALIAFVLASLILLCSAGVFALMSFNVTQRQREIAIRSALGASPHRVLARVMARSAAQLGIGVAAGFLIAAAVPPLSLEDLAVERDPRLIVALAVLMVAIGLLGAVVPARRGLRVQPTDALKET
jgi:predicted permease